MHRVIVFFVLAVVANLGGCGEEEKLKIDTLFKPEVCEIKSKNGDMLTMHYTGTLADGTKFDSSFPREDHERTFVMVKPDGVQRGLVGRLIARFEDKGFKLVAMKYTWASECLLRNHYAELADKAFFANLIEYVGSGPVVPMVWEGPGVVKMGRRLIGATNPSESAPGTIRGDFGLQSGRNLIHGSDSIFSAEREIDLWFDADEIVGWKSSLENWFYED